MAKKFNSKVNSSKETEVKISVENEEVYEEGTEEVTDPNAEEVIEETENTAEEASQEEIEVNVEEESEEDTSDEITVAEVTAPKKVAERYVAVKLQKSHHCTIGGVTYTFEAGKRYNVPVNVKDVLLKEPNLLLPL